MSLERILKKILKNKSMISMYEFKKIVDEYDGCSEKALDLMRSLGFRRKPLIKCLDCGYEGIGDYCCKRCGSDNIKILDYVFVK